MKRVLIVANQTAGGRHLHEEVQRRVDAGPHRFTLLVPATKPHGTLTWTEGEARAFATRRMHEAIESLADLGVEIDGTVGIDNPMDAVMDLLRDRSFDEVIISTLPHNVSRWLRLDLPHRVEKRTGLPVTHVVAPAEDTKSDGTHHAA